MILHTYISGEGEPIVLLHSGGMTENQGGHWRIISYVLQRIYMIR